MTDPAKSAVRDYWDRYARNMSAPGEEWGSAGFFEAIKIDHDRMYGGSNVVLDLEAVRGRDLLELACGIGLDTVEFAGHGARVTSIDFSPTCLDLARRFLGYRGLSATVESADAESLPYGPESFDVVVARGLLMFTPDDRGVVSEMLRVLRPGGEANILVHHRFSWYVALAALSGTNRVHVDGEPPLNRLYSVAGLRSLLSGFSSVKLIFDRLPVATRRGGLPAALFNRVVVPAARALPARLLNRTGYYIIAKAFK